MERLQTHLCSLVGSSISCLLRQASRCAAVCSCLIRQCLYHCLPLRSNFHRSSSHDCIVFMKLNPPRLSTMCMNDDRRDFTAAPPHTYFVCSLARYSAFYSLDARKCSFCHIVTRTKNVVRSLRWSSVFRKARFATESSDVHDCAATWISQTLSPTSTFTSCE